MAAGEHSSGSELIRTKHQLAPATPIATPHVGLHPGLSDTIPDFARGHAVPTGHGLADRFVSQDVRECFLQLDIRLATCLSDTNFRHERWCCSRVVGQSRTA